jgi:hypothetical protein
MKAALETIDELLVNHSFASPDHRQHGPVGSTFSEHAAAIDAGVIGDDSGDMFQAWARTNRRSGPSPVAQ